MSSAARLTAPENHHKLRKGTFSCQECKRRKKRCRFDFGNVGACVSCRRNGTACLSQTGDKDLRNGAPRDAARLDHLERLLQSFTKGKPSHQNDLKSCRDDVAVERCTVFPALGSPWNHVNEARYKRQYLHDFLVSKLPDSDTVATILTRGESPLAVLEHKSSNMAHARPTGQLPSNNPQTVSLARDLIQLALCLERLHLSSLDHGTTHELGETDIKAGRDYIDAARHVTRDDSLVRSVEGCEILMLESSYDMKRGHIQEAWLLARRAVCIADSIRNQDAFGSSDRDTEMIWLKLVAFDRFLSLTIGQPCAVIDDGLEKEDRSIVQSPADYLRQLHIVLSDRILTRNKHLRMKLQGCNDDHDDLAETGQIDHDLRQAVRDIPTSWWRLSYKDNRAKHGSDMVAQIQHFDLIMFLHQPYHVLGLANHLYSLESTHHYPQTFLDYSGSACLIASREILLRFNLCCKDPQTLYSLGGTTPKIFLASLNILLVHIGAHQNKNITALEYQRSSNLSIVDQAIGYLLLLTRSWDLSLVDCDPNFLAKMQALEEAVFRGKCVQILENSNMRNEDIILRFRIPFLGQLCIIEGHESFYYLDEG